MHTVEASSGELVQKVFELARLAVPRRVYSKGHFDYVGAIVAEVVKQASGCAGYRQVGGTDVLGHFFTKFEPLAS
jgi:tryptophanase